MGVARGDARRAASLAMNARTTPPQVDIRLADKRDTRRRRGLGGDQPVLCSCRSFPGHRRSPFLSKSMPRSISSALGLFSEIPHVITDIVLVALSFVVT